MIRLVPVKLVSGKAEEFDAQEFTFATGESVIVDTEKGLAIGKVLSPPHQKERRLLLKTPKKAHKTP